MAVIKKSNGHILLQDGFDTSKRTYDAGEAQEESSLITAISSQMKDEDVAIIAIAQEQTEESYNYILEKFDAATVPLQRQRYPRRSRACT
ncbi:hypothetical protein [Planococcus shenhongbingii]|uniref:Uncharacterized protein n=1 Tax=Planococcus shenhongbingii TaxID=3058398 RepID=A0ABT8N9K9_9BACL|nr:hypothetical protein [Planococcus sp. N017]MDN7244575.1 hypothetical protein [Planococcus sp. N017]